ncbi:MAG: R3H domain-containing nucleic acid-binding protein [Myxococcota bacterium]
MDLDEAKEFTGTTREEAIEKASRHFGLPAERLQLRFLGGELKISGLSGRLVVLAAPSAEPPAPLGPVGTFAAELLRHMQLSGSPRVNEASSAEGLVLTLSGEGLESRARQDGRLEAALAHLIQRAAQKLGDPEAPVTVRIGRGERRRERTERSERPERRRERRPARGRGGREQRASEGDPDEHVIRLETLARRAAEQVRQTGEAAVLEPMGSRDRWIVHNAINELPGVRSESVSEGRAKRVKIEPV